MPMLYEKRTYQVPPGRMPEVTKLYQEMAMPALDAGGFLPYLVGYFISDTGPLHQLIHIWRFEDDAARRDFWGRVYKDEGFMAFVAKIRPILLSQEVQLMTAAPWAPPA